MKRMIAAALLILILLSAYGYAQEAQEAEPLKIDMDLSGITGTMVYAQVYQMLMEPEAYLGKVIRISGWLDVFEDDFAGVVYTSCVIPDATGCCAQGLEFVWQGEHAYPEDYPELGTNLTVTGRFETYMEGEWTYIHLVDAEVVWDTEEL